MNSIEKFADMELEELLKVSNKMPLDEVCSITLINVKTCAGLVKHMKELSEQIDALETQINSICKIIHENENNNSI